MSSQPKLIDMLSCILRLAVNYSSITQCHCECDSMAILLLMPLVFSATVPVVYNCSDLLISSLQTKCK